MSEGLAAPYDAILFDNDGVLVEPTDRSVLVDAVVDAFWHFGVDIDHGLARQTVVEDHVPTDLARAHGIDPEAFWHHRELTASAAQREHVLDGGKAVYDDVAALARLDAPLGVVSNNQHATVAFLLSYHDLDLFEVAHGRQPTLDGAAKRKPQPGYLQAAMTALGASDALYVGDRETDVVAARRAGLDSVLLRRAHVPDDSPSVDPTAELSDLLALVDRLGGSTASDAVADRS